MIKIIAAVFFLSICSTSMAQEVDYLHKDTYYQLSKKVFINKYELTNKAYNAFLDNYSGKIDREFLSINNQLWVKGKYNKSYNKVNRDFYHTEAKWEKHPVVNIQQIAAKTYCKWLTARYHQQANRDYKKVVFRLPTEKEWMKAYRKLKNQIDIRKEKLIYSTEFPAYKTELSEAELELKKLSQEYKDGTVDPEALQRIDTRNLTDDFQARPVDYAFDTTQAAVYNLIGNVSEWLVEENKAIALNWNVRNDRELKQLTNTFKAQQASPVIGFRIVMEVIEK